MKVQIAKDNTVKRLTFQKEFPDTTKCCYCKSESRLAFVAHELDHPDSCVCDLYDNDPKGKGYWLHDACAVAVYLCKGCLKPTALCNQG